MHCCYKYSMVGRVELTRAGEDRGHVAQLLCSTPQGYLQALYRMMLQHFHGCITPFHMVTIWASATLYFPVRLQIMQEFFTPKIKFPIATGIGIIAFLILHSQVVYLHAFKHSLNLFILGRSGATLTDFFFLPRSR